MSVVRLTRALEYLLVQIETNENIPFERKEQFRQSLVRGFYLLAIGGVRPSAITRDGKYIWPSQPGSSRKPGEQEGHEVVGNTCTCKGAQNNIPCWARGATAILKTADEQNIPDVQSVDKSGLFDEQYGPVEVVRQSYRPVRNRVLETEGERVWKK